ncbi:MAG: F0F1 ATP synthase subunit A [Planctomycetota bacterium]
MNALFVLAADPISHSTDHKFIVVGDGFWLWSAYCTQLVLAGLITFYGMRWIAGKIATGPESEGTARYITKNPIAGMIECVCLYLRDEIVRPLLHERTEKLMPFFWSLFFFILVANLIGLIPLLDVVNLIAPGMIKEHMSPIGGTPTQSVYVTAILAIFAAAFINLQGLKELGTVEYVKHLTGGVPLKPLFAPIIAVVFVIEVLGTFIKPVALAIRLFANMTAGHILLAQLLVFTGVGAALLAKGDVVPGSIAFIAATLGSFAIYLLEIFVGFLQAFIFMFLTAVFTSLLAHHDEEHDHADDDAVIEVPRGAEYAAT